MQSAVPMFRTDHTAIEAEGCVMYGSVGNLHCWAVFRLYSESVESQRFTLFKGHFSRKSDVWPAVWLLLAKMDFGIPQL